METLACASEEDKDSDKPGSSPVVPIGLISDTVDETLTLNPTPKSDGTLGTVIESVVDCNLTTDVVNPIKDNSVHLLAEKDNDSPEPQNDKQEVITSSITKSSAEDARASQEREQDEETVMDIVEDTTQTVAFWNYQIESDFSFGRPLAATSAKEFQLSTSVPAKTKKIANFMKGVKWAPDGSCFLANSDDDVLRLFNVPEEFHTVTDWKENPERSLEQNIPSLESVLRVKEGGLVYDYCWYPLMSSYDPVSSCFLSTSSDSPVHLWDAFTGDLRASYLAYNHLDQVISARSLAFGANGEEIHCGFDTMIRTFNITRPGRQCFEKKLKHPMLCELNQPGIISSIAINPALHNLMAVGSYLKTVGLYNNEDSSVICILEGHLGGITHLQFSPDGSKLFSGGRKDSRLICWDLRFMGEEYKIYDRVVSTQQRIYFDITPNGQYLVSGGTDGYVRIWDLKNECENPITLKASSDCTNGVSLNPFLPVLATASGQRHLDQSPDFSDEDEDNVQNSDNRAIKFDRDIRLWKFCES